jgi:hypothetical protein
MHRFVWNLRYPAPGARSHQPRISAIPRDTPLEPLGVLAVPGRYVARLTVGGTTVSRSFSVTMDPRIKTPAAGLARQFELATKLSAAMTRTFEQWSAEADAARKRDLGALNGSLSTLYELIEETDAAPTAQAEQAIASVLSRVR